MSGAGAATDADRHERIHRRAYGFWQQEGRPDGRTDDHRVRAEAEITGAHGQGTDFGAKGVMRR